VAAFPFWEPAVFPLAPGVPHPDGRALVSQAVRNLLRCFVRPENARLIHAIICQRTRFFRRLSGLFSPNLCQYAAKSGSNAFIRGSLLCFLMSRFPDFPDSESVSSALISGKYFLFFLKTHVLNVAQCQLQVIPQY
jgi:hypothetical protein